MKTDTNKHLFDLKKTVGKSSEVRNPEPESGFEVWIENGVWYTAPKIDPAKFGGHAYAGGGYSRGVRECPCGCYMGSSSSSGPVDPFGACPFNPIGEWPES